MRFWSFLKVSSSLKIVVSGVVMFVAAANVALAPPTPTQIIFALTESEGSCVLSGGGTGSPTPYGRFCGTQKDKRVRHSTRQTPQGRPPRGQELFFWSVVFESEGIFGSPRVCAVYCAWF